MKFLNVTNAKTPTIVGAIVRGRDYLRLLSSPTVIIEGFVPKAFIPLRGIGHFNLSAFASRLRTAAKLKCPPDFVRKAFVRGMRFELTRPFGRYHLKVVRLPISPPTHPFCRCKI